MILATLLVLVGPACLIPSKKTAQESEPSNPSVAIHITAFLYLADSGEIAIESDPASGRLTDTFYFKAHNKNFPDRLVEVAGAVNNLPHK